MGLGWEGEGEVFDDGRVGRDGLVFGVGLGGLDKAVGVELTGVEAEFGEADTAE